MSLSPEDLTEPLPSGGTKLVDRTQWAVVYLAKAGLVTRTRRGHIALNERGQERPRTEPGPDQHSGSGAIRGVRSFYGRNLNKTEEDDCLQL
jgi:hypothetical protein